MKTPFVLLFLVCGLAIADELDNEAYENQCHDQAAWDKIDDLLKKVPNDQLVIRAYAMRLGICRLIEEKKISLESGVRVFDLERQRAVMERSMDEAGRKRQKSVPSEEVDPLG
jgi:hypothetical protein